MLGCEDSFSPTGAINLFSFDPLFFGHYLCRGKKPPSDILWLNGKELNDHNRPLLSVKACFLQLEMCGHKER